MIRRKGVGVFVVFVLLLSGVRAFAADSPPFWAGRMVSLQGPVSFKTVDQADWRAVQPEQTFQAGDILRIEENGRAAVLLPNQTVLRLDQKTTLRFTAPQKAQPFVVRLLKGAAHFFSRTPRSLKVETPFVNASVEGTEFYIRVREQRAEVILFEGRVLAENEAGRQVLTKGQSVEARAGQAPVLTTVVRPRDAVAWTLYYPPVLDVSGNKPIQVDLRAAQELLNVGRVAEADAYLEKVLGQDPDQGGALALRAISLVARNRVDEAFGLVRKAVSRAPELAAAHLADSYVRQALFDLPAAVAAVERAVKSEPQNALAWARLSELRLSLGQRKVALAAAQKAAALAPDLGHTQNVLGFAHLTQTDMGAARESFQRAIALDPAAPLSRLGLGLVMIHQGDLAAGRAEMEIAAILDPGNSLIRSYLGKAYVEERNDAPAAAQLQMAKELDAKDPTPWYYDALRKQAQNRPVEALEDLQKAMELNDNRAVYRSRLLLDEDLAARNASLAAIYSELGFEQQALVEGWRSLNTDPGSHSAHRFMADLYGSLPRHEIARVSEVLQSQMLQPVITRPVSPQLSQSGLFIQQGAGPSSAGYNEYNPLFARDKMSLSLNGVVGGNATAGSDLAISGVSGNGSFSLGRFHYKSDGFRDNNDQEHEIFNFLTQYNLSPDTMIQAEFRHVDSERGDIELTFTGDFNEFMRQAEEINSIRIGARHSFAPGSDLLASLTFQDIGIDIVPIPIIQEIQDMDVFFGDIQYQHRKENLDVVGGIFHRQMENEYLVQVLGMPITEHREAEFSRFYLYAQGRYPQEVDWTIGFGADRIDKTNDALDVEQINPKFGVTWTPFPNTTFRGAVFRSLARPWSSEINLDPSMEPAHVAGFNQEYFDPEGSDTWRYGGAVDFRMNTQTSMGLELSLRDIEVPVEGISSEVPVRYFDREERIGRVYFNWMPSKYLAVSAEYLYEWYDRPDERTVIGVEQFSRLETHRFPLGLRFFLPSGVTIKLVANYIDQSGDFVVPGVFDGETIAGDDRFWIVDAGASYSIPGLIGKISFEAKNLFDERFSFQDTDPTNPRISPGILVLLRASFAF